jgi:DNA-binding NarL/FixJ family response regulator
MTVEYQLIVLLAALAVSALAVIRAIQVQRRNSLLVGRLSEVTGSLEDIRNSYDDLQERYRSSLEFQQNLSEAAITTRLQAPRLAAQSRPDAMAAPERYRYVHRLAENGMAAEEIAEVLSISGHEARQLVNLARLAAPRSGVTGR